MSVTLEMFMQAMEAFAPRELAESWDNVGLLIEPKRQELKTILFALDPTPEAALEAVETGADLLFTHHPMFKEGVKRITQSDAETRAAWTLMTNGIGHFCAHTNLDEAPGGVNDVLAELLSLKDVKRASEKNANAAPIRLGRLETPQTLSQFAKNVSQILGIEPRFSGEADSLVEKVAVCGGSGMSLFDFVKEFGVDAYVTSDIKHHQALTARAENIALIDATHDASERVVLKPLINRLQERFDALQCIVTLKCAKERSVWRA